MSWSEATWAASEGSAPLVAALTSALTAHPAWEFVEEAVETQKYEGEEGFYDGYTYPFQVWRCKKSVSGLAADFYIAFSRVIQYSPGSGTGEAGYFAFFGAEEYDEETHWARHQVGKYSYAISLDAGEGGLLEDDWYPWLQPRVEEGGTTWGWWGDRGKSSIPEDPIETETMHLMAATAGTSLTLQSFYDSDTSETYGTYKAYIRVTATGLLVSLTHSSSYGSGTVYIGAYDVSRTPEMMRGEVPLLFANRWGSSDSMQVLGLSRAPGIRVMNDTSKLLRTPSRYGFGKLSGSFSTARDYFPFKGFEEYVAIPHGMTAYYAHDVPSSYLDVIWPIPGIWLLSSEGVPSGWAVGDTMTGPDGHECVLLQLSYSDYFWYLVDKELL